MRDYSALIARFGAGLTQYASAGSREAIDTMDNTTDNGPSGIFHPTTAVGLLLRKEQIKQASKSEIDLIWEDCLRRINAPLCAPAVRARTREQIAEAQAKLEEGRTYYRLNADGALEPINK